jgi:hypothetical protein
MRPNVALHRSIAIHVMRANISATGAMGAARPDPMGQDHETQANHSNGRGVGTGIDGA